MASKSPASMEFSGPKTETAKEVPIQSAFRYLTAQDGNLLQIMTRTNPVMVNAARIGYIFDQAIKYRDAEGNLSYGSNYYVSGYIEQIMRLAVSLDGKSRQEIIDALGNGSKLPDSYFTQNRQAFEVLND